MPFPEKSLRLAIWLPVILISSLSALGTAAETAGKEDTTALITVEQADAILLELHEIRRVLEKIEKKSVAQPGQASQRPTTATVTVDKNHPAMGQKDAPVTVVEFTDYQCPFCKRFAQTTFPSIKRDYIDTGKVWWVVRDLPLSMHRDARKAAQAVHCADEQERFWEMHNTLFTNSPKLNAEFLQTYAGQLELNISEFSDCLKSDRHLDSIDQDIQEASRLGITGTPTFVVGKSGNSTMSGNLIAGAQPLNDFAAAFDRILNADKGADQSLNAMDAKSSNSSE